ncbi:hypothetical protein SAMN05421805_11560 [Saccharopolyspora antimicrobica]|uniref:MYXO-CTERM domain-containing protein n=1 Tax=Saccharopolyspora antimicrobica TaxID=455193 RepID=A0A1I5HD54_9PSEU|nr:hypothetical protein [Saccharopolyspora antimicrobica]RKT85361.1 hypothetical protein ATL45_3701 [Saccharopolyspora antimicrobica]SFO46204.1 hypothetical protein SAMN05421805_11560 [Saccharopolyspora antimicrobica]
MWRTGRVLAGLAIALSLFLVPPAAVAEEVAAPPTTVVVAQEPPPAPPAEQPPADAGTDARQRMGIGIAGFVLIGAVLLSRRLRKKPVLFVKWKK